MRNLQISKWIKNISSIFLTFFGVLIFIAWLGNSKPDKLTSAPEFKAFSINGNSIELSEFKGKIVILNFWATWCPPCRLEMPSFERVAKNHPEVIFIGVSLYDPKQLEDWLKTHSINYQIIGVSQSLVADYNAIHPIDKIPTTFVIDRKGNISKIQEEFYSELQLRWDIFRLE